MWPHYGIIHLVSLGTVIACIVLIALQFGVSYSTANESANKTKDRILKGIPVLMVFMEIIKDLYLAGIGKFGIGYLPLHLCSLGIPVFLLCEYLPDEKYRRVFMEIAQTVILPGSVMALLFPDWHVYPVFSFLNIYSWVWHLLLVLYPILLYRFRRAVPDIRHMHYGILFLTVCAVPVYLFDKKFNCNYMFVNWPPAGTPLELIARFMGNPGYLIGYLILIILVLLLTYGIYRAIGVNKTEDVSLS